MKTTPNLRLPYPEDPDTPNVPRDIKALAMALDSRSDVGQKIQVIDPKEADFGWNDFPRGSTNGSKGFSGPSQKTDWDTSKVLNPAARWKFTAPSDGALTVTAYIFMGYNNGIEQQTIWQEMRLHGGALSGTVQGVHPNYVRWRYQGASSDTSDIIDNTLTITANLIVTKGAVLSPYVAWRGKVLNDSGNWRPKWSGGRMQGLFIPGGVERIDPPSNNSTTKEAATAAYTDDTRVAGFDLPEIE